RAAGEPNVSVMAILQHVESALAMKASRDDIKTPKDLDGKIYAGYGSATEDATIKTIIKNAGGKGEDQTVALKTAAYEALYADRADFVIPFVAWEGIEAELRGQPYKYFYETDYGFPDHYDCIMVGNEQWLANHSDLARRFVKATIRGFQFAADHPDE